MHAYLPTERPLLFPSPSAVFRAVMDSFLDFMSLLREDEGLHTKALMSFPPPYYPVLFLWVSGARMFYVQDYRLTLSVYH